MTLRSLQAALADIIAITRQAFFKFLDDECTQRSAGLAYYALFSIFPLLLLSISVLGFMLEAGVPFAVDAETLVLQAAARALPQAEELVRNILVATRKARGSTGLIGLVTLAWSASNLFIHTRLTFDKIWDTQMPNGLTGVVRLRVNALVAVVITGFLLLTATLTDTILGVIARLVQQLPGSETLWALGRPLLVLGITAFLFAGLYRYLPRAPVGWSQVWPGAIIATVGWEVLKQVFLWYATSLANWAQVYGPITGVIGLLLWLYLSAHVVLFGGEFAAAYSRFLEAKQASPVEVSEEQLPIAQGDLPAPRRAPQPRQKRGPGLAQATIVGLFGAIIALAVMLTGLLATVRRLLDRGAAD